MFEVVVCRYVHERGMMRKRIRISSDMVCRALDHLCLDIQMGIIAVPEPEVLTRALLDLFPTERLIPSESCFALNVARVVTWCVEEGHELTQRRTEKSLWLKRRLSRYM